MKLICTVYLLLYFNSEINSIFIRSSAVPETPRDVPYYSEMFFVGMKNSKRWSDFALKMLFRNTVTLCVKRFPCFLSLSCATLNDLCEHPTDMTDCVHTLCALCTYFFCSTYTTYALSLPVLRRPHTTYPRTSGRVFTPSPVPIYLRLVMLPLFSSSRD